MDKKKTAGVLAAGAAAAGLAYYEKKIKYRSYSGIASVPRGTAGPGITEGCLAIEGGSLRGLYSAGVLDALMINGINMQTVIGVSAGAMDSFNYVSGQIGRTARFNLSNRYNQRYVGIGAYIENLSPFGFKYAFHAKANVEDFDTQRFYRPERGLVAVATNMRTGRPEYFEKGKTDDIFQAIRASSTLPVLSAPVQIDGEKYMDGGCSVNIPYQWPLDKKFDKIVVVRTRTRAFRKCSGAAASSGDKKMAQMERRIYRRYPAFLQQLQQADARYDRECEDLERLEKEGRIFVIAPSVEPTVTRLERDLEKLGQLYWLGFHDAEACLDDLKAYLADEEKAD